MTQKDKPGPSHQVRAGHDDRRRSSSPSSLRLEPGSPFTQKHLVSNTEFTREPICTASHTYQKQKIDQLRNQGLSEREFEKQYNDIVSKECLCIGLSNAAIVKYDLPPVKNLKAVTICPGPNIAYFDKIVTLQEMTDHIYGRTNILGNQNRPHMFIKELQLNIVYLREQAEGLQKEDMKKIKDALAFGKQLLEGVGYYRSISGHMPDAGSFNSQLDQLEKEVAHPYSLLSTMLNV